MLGIAADPVTIERLEYEVVEHAFDLGIPVAAPTPRRQDSASRWWVPVRPASRRRHNCAQSVMALASSSEVIALAACFATAFPSSRWRNRSLIDGLTSCAPRIEFRTGVTIGEGGMSLDSLQEEFDAVLLAIGSTRPRLIPVRGAELAGVYRR